MVRFSTQDLNEIHRVGQSLSGPGDLDGFRSEALRLLGKSLSADKGNFFLFSRSGNQPCFSRVATRGVGDRYLQLYRRYYHTMDPFLKALGTSPPDVVTTDAIVSYRNFTRTEYYNDFLKPQSIHYQMVIHLRSGPRLLGVVALFRPREASNFSDTDRAKASLMAPYLTGALEKAIYSETLSQRDAILKALSPDLPYKGLLVLDEALEPAYCSPDARDMLSYLKGSDGIPGDSALGLPKEVYRRCRDLLSRPPDTTLPESLERVFEWVSPGTRQKVLIRLRLIESGPAPLILLCLEPEEHALCVSGWLREQGLTRRETEVALLLTEGLRNAEIAERLRISGHTVDNHLKSIYRKMRVRNRTGLAHRIMRHLKNPNQRPH